MPSSDRSHGGGGWRRGLALACLLALAGPASAQAVAGTTFVTLGTAGGPVIRADRSQPANLLLSGGKSLLVDAGDGASERLAALGLQPRDVTAVFLSHLHVDHVGGLQGLIGIRWMLGATEPLTIYGPPGTDALVAGVVASLASSARIGFGLGGPAGPTPASTVRVVVVHSGDDLRVAGIRVRALANTHYAGSPDPRTGEPLSLSYRFDCGDRSIGYTGDTGPSAGLGPFMRGVDLLVSEVIDVAATIADSRRTNRQLTPVAERQLEKHLAEQHLPPEEAGRIAAAAKAGELVLTHLAVPGTTAASEPQLLTGVHRAFAGRVRVARDLDRF